MASDQEMLDRIAKLSTAINQQKSIRGGRGGGAYIPNGGGSTRGRGSYSMPPVLGRGGGHMSLVNNSSSTARQPYYNPIISKPYIRPSTPAAAPVSQNRKLFLNGPPQPQYPVPTTYRPAPSPHAAYMPPPTSSYRLPPQAPIYRMPVGAVKRSQHKKLIINHKGNSTTNNTMVKSIDAATGRKQVAIDGVDFVVKGKKLIRKDIFDSNITKSSFMAANTPKVLVRRTLKSAKSRDKNQNMILGKSPIRRKKQQQLRGKGGNMVFTREPEGYIRQGRSGKSLVLNTRRKEKKPRYCGFYTRYGKCPNAGRCPFQHDPARRAICPRFLQNRCKKGLACKLSHTPNQHNMPHCVHFQKGNCKNDPCIYIHVRVSQDAPVCKAFAMEGYCQKGLTCDEKHIHVCPEFAETGKCSNANCRLPHVAKRTDDKKATGIVKLGSWVSPQYFHAQKVAKAEKRKAIEEATAAKVWTRPVLKEEVREKEEQDGFVRLFDDSDDDDGWSQYERDNESGQDIKSLRFNEDDEDEAEEDEESAEGEEEGSDEKEESEDDDDEDNEYDEEMDDNDDEGAESDLEEVYEEVSDESMSDDDDEGEEIEQQ